MTISDYNTKSVRGDRANCTGTLEIALGSTFKLYGSNHLGLVMTMISNPMDEIRLVRFSCGRAIFSQIALSSMQLPKSDMSICIGNRIDESAIWEKSALWSMGLLIKRDDLPSLSPSGHYCTL